MKNEFNLGSRSLPSLKKGLLTAGFVCLTLLFSTQVAQAADVELAKEDLACLKCHDKENIFETTEKGEKVSLTISTKAFVESMHNETTCEDCHDDIDGKTHGKVATPMKSKRDYRMSFQNSCTTCHKKNVEQFADSVHATMVKDGSDKAPTCSDCHNSHTVRSVKLVEPIANVPCANCHEAIFKAYSKDVHGLERVAKGKSAPLCADCHSAHKIKAASLGDTIKDNCITCHKDSADKHEVWLPNSKLHFEAVSCPVCHAPDAQRRVNLRLVDKVGGKQISEKKGVPQFAQLARVTDGPQPGLSESELQNFLKEFKLDDVSNKVILSGRLEVRSGEQAHQLSEKEKAIKDCKVCHQAGAAPFQSVVLTVAGPDGRTLRHSVEKDVLNSLTAMGSMRGFYAIGSTRIKLLDYLLVLVLLGVLCVPIGHLTAHRLFKAKRDQLNAERAKAAAQTHGDATK